ncbi:MAG TPA: rhomboid family intramembrane serine protease [Kofleriaceae bacterium]|nr:rhomboid family intramembrane serine protease [Kofleriaceae bacterium]
MSEARLKPALTYALIAANVAMFAVELARGADVLSPRLEPLVELGAIFPPFVREQHAYWRIPASMFLHLGALHLGLNMLCLYQARIVEAIYGHFRFAVIYLAAGLAGGFAALWFGPANVVTVGASGAVFGVYGAFGAFLLIRRAMIPREVWQPLARSLGSFLALNLIIGFAVPGISLTSHVGGVIAGAALSALMLVAKRVPPPTA